MSQGCSNINNKPVSPITIINKQQVIKQKKKTSTQSNKRSLPTSPTTPTMPSNEITKKTKLFASPNRYSALSNTVESVDNDDPPKSPSQEPSDTTTHAPTKVSLPPPIFIKGVLNYSALLSELTELTGPNSFVCKSTSTHLKVQPENSDDYRKIIHFLNENNASFHTYQLQSEKSYRVVIRNLHPSTPTADISSAIEEIGFSTRQVTNIKHHQTKMALPMFFVDLEPDPSNKDIFNVKSILHTLVKVEEPHKRRDIPQCLNCQSYGHTRAYCSYPPRCVKCGEGHPTSVCEKTPDTPATCALCSGSHPANYKGCTVHKELQNRRRHPLTSTKLTQKPHLKHPLQCPAPSTSSPSSNLQSNTHPRSYANVTGNDTTHNQFCDNHSPKTDIDVFSKFLDELKSVINPLITLLTSVISKLLDTKQNA